MAQSGSTTTTRSNGNGSGHAERSTMSAVIAGAQVAARDTQRALDGMEDQTLIAGAIFAGGLGLGLFVSGAHRLLVAAALLPAGASGSSISRRAASRAQAA